MVQYLKDCSLSLTSPFLSLYSFKPKPALLFLTFLSLQFPNRNPLPESLTSLSQSLSMNFILRESLFPLKLTSLSPLNFHILVSQKFLFTSLQLAFLSTLSPFSLRQELFSPSHSLASTGFGKSMVYRVLPWHINTDKFLSLSNYLYVYMH